VGGKGNVRKPPATQGARVRTPESAPTNHLSPVFCLRHLKAGYGLNNCGASEAAAFVGKLKSLCDMDWQTIQNASKKAGHEKIPVKQLRADMPARVTEDVKELLVFRFPGDKARFLGLRHDRVFEVYFIDAKGDMYDHGE
jgi:hypothetical protein